jgi:hypothetical protein
MPPTSPLRAQSVSTLLYAYARGIRSSRVIERACEEDVAFRVLAAQPQAVTTEHQVVLAAEIETVGADFGHLEPMLDAAQHELAAAGIDEPPEVLLADAGYWHGEQMQRIVDRGIQVLIPPDTSRRRTTRRNWDGGRYDQMRQVLASERGGELYRKRQPMIEPVFAQMKFNRGLDRFRRRGRGAVRAEWRLITATHNLLKLHRHALAAA